MVIWDLKHLSGLRKCPVYRVSGLRRFYCIFFGSPDVLRFRKQPTNSLTLVRPLRSYSLDRSIFFQIFCMKLGLHNTLMITKKNCLKKILALILPNNSQNLTIFWPNQPFLTRFWPINSQAPP